MREYPATLLAEVGAELDRASQLFPRPQASLHEGYGVLAEEVAEFFDIVRQKHPDLVAARKELIQVAAMALKTIEQVIDPKLALDKVWMSDSPSSHTSADGKHDYRPEKGRIG